VPPSDSTEPQFKSTSIMTVTKMCSTLHVFFLKNYKTANCIVNKDLKLKQSE
jgi:hypothetical protein